ncbi:zinc-binding dehydrogenase [Thozetella sp. PMI_491]|nr:zinc-binding dehydrogenase [Thozetella sp. PMI_491]
MKAFVTDGNGSATVRSDVAIPTPGPGEILVKVTHVAQNPTDWKGMKFGGPAGAIIGCDFAGLIADANGSHWPKGQAVAGLVFGKTTAPPRGAFAEYLVTEAGQVFAIPDGTSPQEAATLPLAYATAAQALVQRLGLPELSRPANTADPVLVSGGATSVGMYAVQLAKQAGLFVVATANPRNHAMLRELGADVVVDYADNNWPAHVRDLTKGRLQHALDCVSEKSTLADVARALSQTQGGKVVTIVPRKQEDLDGVEGVGQGVKVESTIVYTVFGRDVGESTPVYKLFDNTGLETLAGDREFWEKQLRLLPGYLQDGKVKPNPVRERGGLDDLLEGFKEQEQGKVRAEKLVYKI